MSLNGIDIASWQEGIIPSQTDSDFVIIKATGGTNYVNPFWRKWADDVLASGKKLALYHYARERGCPGTYKEEFNHFWNQVKDYAGKFIPVLDWEADALEIGQAWAKRWLDLAAKKTGSKPWFYCYASAVNSHDYSKLTKYPLWMASYLNRYAGGGFVSDPANIWGTGNWSKMTAYQYTSEGCIKGYGGNLDLNVFYGSKKNWDQMCGKEPTPVQPVVPRIYIDCANVAATLMAMMCDDNGFGYSWEERFGTWTDHIIWNINGLEYPIDRGDYDCSSACITCWKLALKYTDYEGCLDAAITTHNMRSVFSDSGLFDIWNTQSTCAVRGDLYLNDQNHVAMCLDGGSDNVYGYDCLGEFCWGDNGAYGNKRGDQSGFEAYVHGFYEYPWDCTLHYNGKANKYVDGSAPSPAPKPDPQPTGDNGPKYRVMAGGVWYDEMIGTHDTGNSGDTFGGQIGVPMQYIAIEGVGIYRVATQANGWLPWVDQYNIGDFEYGCAGDGSPIIALEIPNAGVRYALHNNGAGWNADMVGNHDTGGSSDTFAGAFVPADAVRITWN